MLLKYYARGRAFLKSRSLFVLFLFIFASFATPAQAAARHVFLFIGDGMGAAQRNAAEMYLAGMRAARGDSQPREAQLRMNELPYSGTIRTDSLSGVTDSAAAGTALATGEKTINDAVAVNPKNGKKFQSIAKIAKNAGLKVGIVTSAFIQDATPAAFYAHANKRTQHYDIGLQLAESGFDYFGGGGFRNPNGRDKKSRSLLDIAREKGYTVADTVEAIRGLSPAQGGKIMAIHPKLSAGAIPWAIDDDRAKDAKLGLVDFVQLGIRHLSGESGFFMMVEGGRIDTACHANDAVASIYETIAFDEALASALDFYRAHPDDTLIVVTSDHETGGMNIARAPTDADAFYRDLAGQKGSYAAFERTISPKEGAQIGSYMKRARDFFGPGLKQTPAIEAAFRMSMTPKKSRPTKDKAYKKNYGPYDPFTMACIRELNAHAGVTWTSFYHTGRDVPVSAIGVGAERFSGTYENTEIFHKLKEAMNF